MDDCAILAENNLRGS